MSFLKHVAQVLLYAGDEIMHLETNYSILLSAFHELETGVGNRRGVLEPFQHTARESVSINTTSIDRDCSFLGIKLFFFFFFFLIPHPLIAFLGISFCAVYSQ